MNTLLENLLFGKATFRDEGTVEVLVESNIVTATA